MFSARNTSSGRYQSIDCPHLSFFTPIALALLIFVAEDRSVGGFGEGKTRCVIETSEGIYIVPMQREQNSRPETSSKTPHPEGRLSQ